MTREDDLLTKRAQHFHGESLVAHGQIQSALVAERRTDHRLLIQRRNDRAVDRLRRFSLGASDAVLEQIEGLAHAIAPKLVRISDPRTQAGIRSYQTDEIIIDGIHRRNRLGAVTLIPCRFRQNGQIDASRGEGMVCFLDASLLRVDRECRHSRI
jgi:hypothetical protein